MMSAGPQYLKTLPSTVRFGGVGGFFTCPSIQVPFPGGRETLFITLLGLNQAAVLMPFETAGFFRNLQSFRLIR